MYMPCSHVQRRPPQASIPANIPRWHSRLPSTTRTSRIFAGVGAIQGLLRPHMEADIRMGFASNQAGVEGGQVAVARGGEEHARLTEQVGRAVPARAGQHTRIETL